MKYIDVSEWQGVIEWEKAKPHIDGAILRAGWGKNNPDKRFAYNASECNRLGIPCGAYWFSYAKTPEEAADEARYLLKAVTPYRMELPLCFDFEYDSVENARKQGVTITKELASEFLWRFGSEIEEGGYWCLNYTSPDFMDRYYGETTAARFGLWLASWPAAKVLDLNKPPRKCDIWQWTSKGSVAGITGNVDVSESYVDFAKVIRENGMNHLTPAGAELGAAASLDGMWLPQSRDTEADMAHKWCISMGITDDTMRDVSQTELMFWRYHKLTAPDDYKTASGLLTD